MSSAESFDPAIATDPQGGPALIVVGSDHRSAPLRLREKVSYGRDEAESALVHLLARPEVAEALLVSTCNRTEVYLQPRDSEAAYHSVLELIFRPRAPEMESEGRLYVKHNREAARHLLSVASGLQSMVLGEPEILGQVKQAGSLAEAVGASGPVLRRLLQASQGSGGRTRKETALGSGAVSLGYSVVELARSIFSDLRNTSALILGAGETAQMAARALVEKQAGELRICNRTRQRSEALAESLGVAEALDFETRLEALAEADLVVTAVSAEEPILLGEDLRQAMRRRRDRPLLAVDLGVPRNIEAPQRRVENLFLQDIDSLDSLIQRNLKRRREAVPQAEEIVERELERFYLWFRSLEAEPIVARLQRQAETIRRQELAQARTRFPEELHEPLDHLTRALVRKILHHPSHRLRAGGEDLSERLELVRELFQLGDDDRED